MADEVIKPPIFEDMGDEFHVKTLTDNLPHRWRYGGRDSIDSIGTTLAAARDKKLFKKCGCKTWDQYCKKFLTGPAKAFNELIEGVRILRSFGLKDFSEEQARKASRELGRHGGDRKSRKFQGSDATLKTGRGKEYYAARIKRSHPEIAARIEEFPSMRAAAKAAGIIKEKSNIQKAKALWAKMTAEEREFFKTWISAL